MKRCEETEKTPRRKERQRNNDTRRANVREKENTDRRREERRESGRG